LKQITLVANTVPVTAEKTQKVQCVSKNTVCITAQLNQRQLKAMCKRWILKFCT